AGPADGGEIPQASEHPDSAAAAGFLAAGDGVMNHTLLEELAREEQRLRRGAQDVGTVEKPQLAQRELFEAPRFAVFAGGHVDVDELAGGLHFLHEFSVGAEDLVRAAGPEV